MSVTINEVSIQSDNGTIEAGESLTAWAELNNAGETHAHATVTFTVDGAARGDASVDLSPNDTQWVQVVVGELSAGGHELEATAAIDDGMSSSQASNGISFNVGPGASGAGTHQPQVEIGQLTVRPHTNVEHEDGTAWTGESIGMWVKVRNADSTPAEVNVSFRVDDGEWQSQTVSVPAGGEAWAQHDAPAQQAGSHTFEVWASMETENQSMVVGSDTATLNVVAGNASFQPIDVQLTLHDFRGRPLEGRAIFVQFIGQEGDSAGGAETVEGAMASRGVWTSPNASIPPRGTMTVMAVSIGGADEASEPIEGSVRYHLGDGDTALGFTARQAFEERTITARSLRAVREQLSAEMNAGLEIEVISIGGSVATESEESREFETSVEWKVRYGRAAFEFEADAR